MTEGSDVEPRKASARPMSFSDHLRRALELIDQPASLGAQSPLAAPYFLGEALRGAEATAAGRGAALRAAIMLAAAQLWGDLLPDDGQTMLAAALAESDGGDRYSCMVLELNYFKQRYRPAPRNQAEIYTDILHISRPTHDRHLRRAVERLGVALLDLARPAIYLEQPAPPPALVGRDPLLARLRADLLACKSVALVGHGGAGKTSLGAAAAAAWAPTLRFWYTFRPGLSDRLEGLLFALGRFLREQGVSALWHQLVAEHGRLPDGALALGLALADLRKLPTMPLLCFDELDLLRPADADQAWPTHTQLLAFLDGLRGHVPLLLIGQRAFWSSDALYEAGELTHADLADWLAARAVPHVPADVAHLHDYTAGNPRLAELCVALFQAGSYDSFAAALADLPQAQALLPLWLRLERDLPAAERRLLQTLSVFRTPAPADAWYGETTEQATTLNSLIERRLVQPDSRGGVALLPALREVIAGELPAERREELHAWAAQIRAERGAYTAAAYHLYRAGQPEAAIELWHEHRDHEIEQGQAAAALTIFAQISPRRLPARHAETLLLLRARLHELAGSPTGVVDDLIEASWGDDNPATPEAMLRLGRAVQAQGDRELALQTFQVGLDAAALLRVSTQLYVQRGLVNTYRRDMRQAWREARLAYFHAVVTLGIVSEQSGEYAAARAHYLTALATAEELGYRAGTAETHHYLAALAGRHQALDEALHHFEQAIAFYEQIGDRLSRELVRGNMASAFIQARHFAEAVEPAEQAMRFFMAMGNPFRTAHNASNLAEAHAELGNLDQAEEFANVVLQQNEPQSHPYALYTLGTVYLRCGNLAQAERSYDQSRRLATINDDLYLLAFAWRALGEVARMQGSEERAGPAFAAAVELFRRLQIDEEVRHTEALAAARPVPQKQPL
jgi:tetratricopeptide (TPR) repeat protein